MSQLLIVIFPDEARAYEAARALEDSDDPADAGVRGLAVIVRHADGTVSERKWTSRVTFRAPIGAVVGALIGLPGGPIGPSAPRSSSPQAGRRVARIRESLASFARSIPYALVPLLLLSAGVQLPLRAGVRFYLVTKRFRW